MDGLSLPALTPCEIYDIVRQSQQHSALLAKRADLPNTNLHCSHISVRAKDQTASANHWFFSFATRIHLSPQPSVYILGARHCGPVAFSPFLFKILSFVRIEGPILETKLVTRETSTRTTYPRRKSRLTQPLYLLWSSDTGLISTRTRHQACAFDWWRRGRNLPG